MIRVHLMMVELWIYLQFCFSFILCSLDKTDDWLLVFKAVTNGSESPYSLYISNSTADGGVGFDNTSCISCGTEHYKSSILDEWDDMEIVQVKVSIFKDNLEKSYFIFNGTNSNKENWFKMDSLMYTNYEDINSITEHQYHGQYFSIRGDYGNKRSFFINKKYDSCHGDRGWLVVTGTSSRCLWERRHPNSVIFSPNNQVITWESHGEDSIADFLAIFIKKREYIYHCKRYPVKSMEEIYSEISDMQIEMAEYMNAVRLKRLYPSSPYEGSALVLGIGITTMLCVIIPIFIIVYLDVAICIHGCKKRHERRQWRRNKEFAINQRNKRKIHTHPKITLRSKKRKVALCEKKETRC